MITQKNRFHGYGSLKYVYRNGKTVRGQITSIKYAPNPKKTAYRLAVVVSKKVHKSAVARNRMRRRIYEILREMLVGVQPYDIVVTVYSEQLADFTPKELKESLEIQLEQAGILKPTQRDKI